MSLSKLQSPNNWKPFLQQWCIKNIQTRVMFLFLEGRNSHRVKMLLKIVRTRIKFVCCPTYVYRCILLKHIVHISILCCPGFETAPYWVTHWRIVLLRLGQNQVFMLCFFPPLCTNTLHKLNGMCTSPSSWLLLFLQDSDNPDLRDRGYIYWRLLSTDPVAAKEVVLAEKPLISEETDLIEPTLLEELICHIGTLASVYHKPPSAFVEGSRGVQHKRLPGSGGS